MSKSPFCVLRQEDPVLNAKGEMIKEFTCMFKNYYGITPYAYRITPSEFKKCPI